MKKILLIISAIAMFFIINGCVSSGENRKQRISSKYPGLDAKTIEMVTNRQVAEGMTREMVVASIGKPYLRSTKGDVAVWEYGEVKSNNDGFVYMITTQIVQFRDNKVVSIQRVGKKWHHRGGY